MKSWFLFIALTIVLTSVSCTEKAHTLGVPGSPPFAQTLPDFSLNDPNGNTFTNESISKDGIVLVVTAPILKNKSAQEKWNKYLLKAKAGSKAKLAFMEDMQPSLFKGVAIKGMKKDYKFGKEPILLIDNDGEIRRALKVPKGKTIILVYDRDGKLVHLEAGKPSAQAAETMWKKVKGTDKKIQ
ncbi:hypothetical protein [Candidatus Kuenenia sp.]|uniref:hypothetical protein n=1 Tax=Candidatus Kuenenia sp. TaxID=2499824 RepID=UPI003220257F